MAVVSVVVVFFLTRWVRTRETRSTDSCPQTLLTWKEQRKNISYCCCSVGTILFTAIGISLVAIAAHGAFRVPDDLFLDDSEVRRQRKSVPLLLHTACNGHGPPPCRGPFEGAPSCLPRTDRQSLRVRIPVSQSLSSLTPGVLVLKRQRTKREARADCLHVRLCSQRQPTTACWPSSWAASHRRQRQGQMQCSSSMLRAAGLELGAARHRSAAQPSSSAKLTKI